MLRMDRLLGRSLTRWRGVVAATLGGRLPCRLHSQSDSCAHVGTNVGPTDDLQLSRCGIAVVHVGQQRLAREKRETPYQDECGAPTKRHSPTAKG